MKPKTLREQLQAAIDRDMLLPGGPACSALETSPDGDMFPVAAHAVIEEPVDVSRRLPRRIRARILSPLGKPRTRGVILLVCQPRARDNGLWDFDRKGNLRRPDYWVT